jgi:hypothetical protein
LGQPFYPGSVDATYGRLDIVGAIFFFSTIPYFPIIQTRDGLEIKKKNLAFQLVFLFILRKTLA